MLVRNIGSSHNQTVPAERMRYGIMHRSATHSAQSHCRMGSLGNLEEAALTLTVEGNLGLPIPADINHDGLVNGNDLAAVLSAWGTCANCPADINQDGQIDGIDLATLLSAWTG